MRFVSVKEVNNQQYRRGGGPLWCRTEERIRITKAKSLGDIAVIRLSGPAVARLGNKKTIRVDFLIDESEGRGLVVAVPQGGWKLQGKSVSRCFHVRLSPRLDTLLFRGAAYYDPTELRWNEERDGWEFALPQNTDNQTVK